jgi:endonuclease/exonuclease/phosphatase family metal-dependent hydrolase
MPTSLRFLYNSIGNANPSQGFFGGLPTSKGWYMTKKPVAMQVVTWNVGRRKASLLDALSRFGEFDLVTLQEVGVEVAHIWERRVRGDLKLKYVHYSRRLDVPCQSHINLIASRWPLEAVDLRYPTEKLPWPQALTEVLLKVGTRSVVVITAHIPNGTNYGWEKIDTFWVLKEIVDKAKGAPCIVTGDFNEPRYAIRHGRVLTWGQQEGRFVYWEGSKDGRGRFREGKEWDDAVRWLFEKQDEHGLRHAYWEARGHPAKAATYITHGRLRWFDHMFVSRKFFRVKECRYLHELRGPRLSDHSALSARLVLDARL